MQNSQNEDEQRWDSNLVIMILAAQTTAPHTLVETVTGPKFLRVLQPKVRCREVGVLSALQRGSIILGQYVV